MFVIETRKISDSVGADVLNIDIRAPLTDEMREALMQAWAQFLVLRFRGQPLSDPELIAFSKNLGELEPPGPNPQGKPYLPEFPELNVISNIKQGGQALGGLGDGEAIWHSDMTYASSVPMGAVLHAIEIPPSGGNTYWSNLYRAHDTLPLALKNAIRGRKSIHDSTYNSAGIMRRLFGSKESRRCSVAKLSHRIVSWACHSCTIVNSGCVACAQSWSSRASLSSTGISKM